MWNTISRLSFLLHAWYRMEGRRVISLLRHVSAQPPPNRRNPKPFSSKPSISKTTTNAWTISRCAWKATRLAVAWSKALANNSKVVSVGLACAGAERVRSVLSRPIRYSLLAFCPNVAFGLQFTPNLKCTPLHMFAWDAGRFQDKIDT